IVIVDDGSTDGTGDIARELGARVISHPTNMGYGASLKTGIRHASHDRIVITDADGTYDVAAIPSLARDLESFHMVVGARRGIVGALAAVLAIGAAATRDSVVLLGAVSAVSGAVLMAGVGLLADLLRRGTLPR